MKFSEICRLCLCTERLFLPLYNPVENLQEKIHTISSRVEVSVRDGLPAQVCQQCVELVNTCYSFKLQCEKSEVILRHYISSHSQYDHQSEGSLKLQEFPVKEERNSVAVSHSTATCGGVSSKEETTNHVFDGQKKVNGRNYSGAIAVSPLCERNLALDWGLNCKNMQRIGPEISETGLGGNMSEDEGKPSTVDRNTVAFPVEKDRNSVAVSVSATCGSISSKEEPLTVDDSFNESDNTASSLSAAVSTPEYKHKPDKPRRLGSKKLKSRFCLAGSWGKDKRSLQAHNTYDVNTENSDSKESASVQKQAVHSSGNGKGDIASADIGCRLVSGIYIQQALYYGNSNSYKKTFSKISKVKSHITVPVKYHQCAVCGKSVQKLNLHMKMHTGEKPYQCSICGQRFIQKGSLQKHNTLHTGERPYSCSLCGKTFRCKSDLNQHTKLHTGDAHKCSICEKEFTTRQNLDSHVRTHTGEKPYLCHTCGMHFTQKGALTKHSRIHANDRPHQCSACNKRFITQSALNLHFRTHTGEKPYTCATCQKSFTDRGYFMRHLMIHSGEKSFVCSVCGKAFTQQISLKRHVRLHTGEKPFRCMLCGENFALKRDLKRHTERIHEANK